MTPIEKLLQAMQMLLNIKRVDIYHTLREVMIDKFMEDFTDHDRLNLGRLDELAAAIIYQQQQPGKIKCSVCKLMINEVANTYAAECTHPNCPFHH